MWIVILYSTRLLYIFLRQGQYRRSVGEVQSDGSNLSSGRNLPSCVFYRFMTGSKILTSLGTGLTLIPFLSWTFCFPIWKGWIWIFVWNFVVVTELGTASPEQPVCHAHSCSRDVWFWGRLIPLESVEIAGFHPRFICRVQTGKWLD